MATKVPRSKESDYTREMADARRRFVKEQTGASLTHVGHFSIDPATLPGNIENFMGVAQVPIGLAGPLRINGEHAKGDFYIPMATSEGTLVASYNRGMRLLSESGGVRTTVVGQFMQRSPAFFFDDALQARDFGEWIAANFEAMPIGPWDRQAKPSAGRLAHHLAARVMNFAALALAGTAPRMYRKNQNHSGSEDLRQRHAA